MDFDPVRRNFLILIPTTVALSIMNVEALGAGEKPAGRKLDAELNRLAEEYFQLFPEERNLEVLLSRLPLNESKRKQGSLELTPTFQTRVLQDFKEGQTVELNRWILSRTEGRILALLTLVSGDPGSSPLLSGVLKSF